MRHLLRYEVIFVMLFLLHACEDDLSFVSSEINSISPIGSSFLSTKMNSSSGNPKNHFTHNSITSVGSSVTGEKSVQDQEQIRMRKELEMYLTTLKSKLSNVQMDFASYDEAKKLLREFPELEAISKRRKKSLVDKTYVGWLREQVSLLTEFKERADFPKTANEWAQYVKANRLRGPYFDFYYDYVGDYTPLSGKFDYNEIIKDTNKKADQVEAIIALSNKIGKREYSELKNELQKIIKQTSYSEVAISKIKRKISDIEDALMSSTIYTWQFEDLMKPIE